MMTLMSFLAAVSLLLLGFVTSVSAGAATDAGDLSPTRPLVVLLVAAIAFVLQALLWMRLGALL